MPRPSVPEGKKAKSSLNVETDSVSEKTGTPRMSVKAKSRKRRLSRRFVIIACSIVAVLAIAHGFALVESVAALRRCGRHSGNVGYRR